MKVIRLAFVAFFLLGSIYFLLPSPTFPAPPSDSLPSEEPADTESIYRQAYYTNLTRDQIMAHYKLEFAGPLQFRLNHPPEDAYTLIRDQTRSNFLEELFHPLKESLYVNGYTPEKEQDIFVRRGNTYVTKVTVRYVPSSRTAQITVWALILTGSYLLLKETNHV